MTKNKIRAVFDFYIAILESKGITPRAQTPEECATTVTDRDINLGHALSLCYRGKHIVEDRPVKANRWLGYVQGILAYAGIFSVNELKGHNRTGEHAYFIVGPAGQRSLMGQLCVIVEDYHDVQNFVLVEFPDILDKGDTAHRRLLGLSLLCKLSDRQHDFVETHGTMREYIAEYLAENKPEDVVAACVAYQRELISRSDDAAKLWQDYTPTFVRTYASRLGVPRR